MSDSAQNKPNTKSETGCYPAGQAPVQPEKNGITPPGPEPKNVMPAPVNNLAAQGLDPTDVAPAPLKPLSLLAFAIKEDETVTATVKVLTTVPIRKPSKEAFFRTHLTHWQTFGLIEVRDLGKTYLVVPEIVATLRDEGEKALYYATLVLAVDKKGNPLLWPLKVSDREMEWHTSARAAAELAKSKWVRVSANMAAGQYDVSAAVNQTGEPKWPEESFDELLRLAFKDRIIDSYDHPVLKELRGEI